MGNEEKFDLAVIGGGINGAGIARDAAGRGLSVLLCEQHDLAAHTSSASTKLIHGGLRYLEFYEFGLVSKALAEREVLLRAAPHIIRPLRFVMPHSPELRPAWLIRAGLFLYDHLDFGHRKLLPGSRAIDLSRHPAGAALDPAFRRGFEYSDGWVDDARLVVLNAMAAAENGARVATRTRCVGTQRGGDEWRLTLERGGETEPVRARALVNATGPWVSEFLRATVQQNAARKVRQVKGSHLVVPALFDHPYAYIFQNHDRRVVFAIPYQDRFTLIGTTEVDWDLDPAEATVDAGEVRYLCDAVNRYFATTVRPEDVVHSFSGVRPLIEDEHTEASAVTRDYQLDLDTAGAPLLSVFGGKITTFRRLAEEALEALETPLGIPGGRWTSTAPLPGGDIANADFEAFLASCRQRYRWLDEALVTRLAGAYGTRIERLLDGATATDDLGEDFGFGIREAELEYLRANEWATCADDVLWRRSTLGLHVDTPTRKRIEMWFAERLGDRARTARGSTAMAHAQ